MQGNNEKSTNSVLADDRVARDVYRSSSGSCAWLAVIFITA